MTTEPTTQSGREFLEKLPGFRVDHITDGRLARLHVLSIEREARAALLDELEAAVPNLEPRTPSGPAPSGWYYDGWNEATEAVLALIQQHREEGT